MTSLNGRRTWPYLLIATIGGVVVARAAALRRGRAADEPTRDRLRRPARPVPSAADITVRQP